MGEEYGVMYTLLFGLLEMFMVFGLYNVIAAIYVDKVIVAAKSSEKQLRQQRLRDDKYLNAKVFDLFAIMWESDECRRNGGQRVSVASSGRGTILHNMEQMVITRATFDELMQNTEFLQVFRDLDITDEDTAHLFDTLDVDRSGTLDLEEIKNGISKLRGTARRSDMVLVETLLRKVLDDLKKLAPSKDYEASSPRSLPRCATASLSCAPAKSQAGTPRTMHAFV